MKVFPDGLEIDAGMASSMLATHWEQGWADLAAPRVLVCEGRFGPEGPGEDSPRDLEPAAAARYTTFLESAGNAPPVVLAADVSPTALAALVVRKLRGIPAAAASAGAPELAAVAELCGTEAVDSGSALHATAAWGGAGRIVMTSRRTWIWAPKGWGGWESAARGVRDGGGSVQRAFAEYEARVGKAMRAPFSVPVADFESPALTGAAFLAGSGPAGRFEGRILLLGSMLIAADVSALAELSRKVLRDSDCLVLALTSVGEGALHALAGGLGALAERVLVGALAPEGGGQDLAMATGGCFAAPELMVSAGNVAERDLGTFTGGRLSGGGFYITGTTEPRQCSGHLKTLNRDYLVAESDAERAALRSRCERFAGMLDPEAMLAYLRGAAEGRW